MLAFVALANNAVELSANSNLTLMATKVMLCASPVSKALPKSWTPCACVRVAICSLDASLPIHALRSPSWQLQYYWYPTQFLKAFDDLDNRNRKEEERGVCEGLQDAAGSNNDCLTTMPE